MVGLPRHFEFEVRWCHCLKEEVIQKNIDAYFLFIKNNDKYWITPYGMGAIFEHPLAVLTNAR